MKLDSLSETVSGYEPAELVRQMHGGDSPDLRRRRGIVGLSLLGMAAMGAVSLLQTGAVKHLPDPPVGPFDSDAANLSEDAFQFGIPDGTLSLASLAANVPLAALGGEPRTRSRPWVPVAAAAKAGVDAAGAAGYLSKMIRGEEAWCPYCVTGAAANFGILALALPEAWRAVASLWN